MIPKLLGSRRGSLYQDPGFYSRRLRIEGIKQVVKGRYGRFAKTGGHKEPC